LDARLHAEVSTELDEVFFYRATRQTEDAANVARALTFLNPGQTLKLAVSDKPGGE